MVDSAGSDEKGLTVPARRDLEIVETMESVAHYAGKFLAENILSGLLGGGPYDESPIRSTKLAIHDRRTGKVITEVRGITYQSELDAARERLTLELETMSTQDLIGYYTTPNRSTGMHWFRVHSCDDCGRAFAGSELRPKGGDRCPACADDHLQRSLWRIIRPQRRVVVPDVYFLARCVDSFIAHGWSTEHQSELSVAVRRARRGSKVVVAEVGRWVQRSSD